jgi:hypothetical protein
MQQSAYVEAPAYSITSSARNRIAVGRSIPIAPWRSVLERIHDRQSADEFRDQAIFQQVLRLDLTEDLPLRSSGANTLALKPIEADRPRNSRSIQ